MVRAIIRLLNVLTNNTSALKSSEKFILIQYNCYQSCRIELVLIFSCHHAQAQAQKKAGYSFHAASSSDYTCPVVAVCWSDGSDSQLPDFECYYFRLVLSNLPARLFPQLEQPQSMPGLCSRLSELWHCWSWKM